MNVLKYTFLALLSCCFASKTQGQSTDRDQEANLVAFAKAFGYVRYFYPTSGMSELDWHAVAKQGASTVYYKDPEKSLQDVLQQIFQPLAPQVEFKDQHYINSIDCRVVETANENKHLDQDQPAQNVYWQHQACGLGLAQENKFFRSVLVNDSIEGDRDQFGSTQVSKDITNYRSDSIRIKLEARFVGRSDNASAQLWSRTNADKHKFLQFVKLNEPISDTTWNDYAVDIKIANNANLLTYGVYINDQAQLLVRNIEVYVFISSVWQKIDSMSVDFSSIHEQHSNKWTTSAQGYHCSRVKDASRYVLSLESVKVAKKIAQPISQLQQAGPPSYRVPIGQGLVIQFPLSINYNIFHNSRLATKGSGYVQNAAQIGSVLEDVHDTFTRVSDIVLIWNVVQHFHPFYDEFTKDWHEALPKAINAIFAQKYQTIGDHQLVLREMLSMTNDGHLQVRHPKNPTFYYPAINCKVIHEKLVVTNVFTDTIPIEVGDIITAINGTHTNTCIENLRKYFPESNTSRSNYNIIDHILSGGNNSTIRLALENKHEILIPRLLFIRDFQRALLQAEDSHRFSGDVGYVNLAKTSYSQFLELFDSLEMCKDIIYDLRGYAINHQFLGHLLRADDTAASWMQLPITTVPDHCPPKTAIPLGWSLKRNEKQLTSKAIFLINEESISYTESILTIIEGYNLGILVGSNSAGINGNVATYELPSGTLVSLSAIKATRINGSSFYGEGFAPDIKILNTRESLIKKIDLPLERAYKLTKEAND